MSTILVPSTNDVMAACRTIQSLFFWHMQALMHPFLEPILPLASLQLALSQAATHAPAAAVAQLPAASHANQQPSARPHASRVSSAAAQSAQQAAGAEPRPQLVKPSAMRAGMSSAAQPSSALLQLQTSRVSLMHYAHVRFLPAKETSHPSSGIGHCSMSSCSTQSALTVREAIVCHASIRTQSMQLARAVKS